MQIVFATDGSEGSVIAGRFLANLPLGPDSTITVHSVVTDERHDHASQVIDSAMLLLQPSRAVLHRLTAHGHPADTIALVAEELDADLIVLGSHGRSAIARFLVGSVAEQVARHARCSVLLARGCGDVLRRIVVGVDSKEGLTGIPDLLKRLGTPPKCEIRLVTILANQHEIAREHVLVTPPLAARTMPLEQWLHEQAAERLQELTSSLAASGLPSITEIRSGDPARGLIDVAADEASDLIVVGSHNQSKLEQFFLGSVSQQVLCHAPCSVLIARNNGKPHQTVQNPA